MKDLIKFYSELMETYGIIIGFLGGTLALVCVLWLFSWFNMLSYNAIIEWFSLDFPIMNVYNGFITLLIMTIIRGK